MTYPGQRPEFPSLSHHFLLVKGNSDKSCFETTGNFMRGHTSQKWYKFMIGDLELKSIAMVEFIDWSIWSKKRSVSELKNDHAEINYPERLPLLLGCFVTY